MKKKPQYYHLDFNLNMNIKSWNIMTHILLVLFGEVEEGILVSDQSRYILQKNVIYLVSDFNKFGKLKVNYSLINSNNTYKDYDGNLSGLIFNLENKQSNFSSKWIKDFSFFKIELNINKSLKEEMLSNYTSITC